MPHKKRVSDDKVHKNRGSSNVNLPLQRHGEDAVEKHGAGESINPTLHLRDRLQELHLTTKYTTPSAGGLEFFGRLEISPSCIIFEHRHAEEDKATARAMAALKALKWLEDQRKFVDVLAEHPDSQPSLDIIVSLVRSWKLSTSDNPLLYQLALNPKLAEENPKMKLIFDEAIEEYRSALVSKDEYHSSLPSQIALVLEGRYVDEKGNVVDDHIRETSITVQFANIAKPLASVKLTDLKHAHLVGKHMAQSMLDRVRSDASIYHAVCVFRPMENGMRAVSDRPSRVMLSGTDATTKPRAKVLPKEDPNSTDLSLSYGDLRNLALIAKRLEWIWKRNENQEEFYRDVGVRLMLQLEIYPRNMALAVLSGFHETWEVWIREKEQCQNETDNAAVPEQGGDQEKKNEQSDISMRSVESGEERDGVGTQESQHEESSLGIDGEGDSKMRSALSEEASSGKLFVEESPDDDELHDTTMRSTSTQESSSEESTIKYSTPKRSVTRLSSEPTTEDSTSEDLTEKLSESVSDTSTSFNESDLDASTPKKSSHSESPAAETTSEEEQPKSEESSDVSMKSVE